jgi:NADP-dependent 3-hydroxy acid dehydrogenase YdfG
VTGYRQVLIIAGIGEALAEKLISEGSFVIVTGRRKENLDQFIERNGSDKAEAFEFDISKLDNIPSTLGKITKAHKDIDCVVLNAGIQRRSGRSNSRIV